MRNQSVRTFQKKLDFITTPGWLSGPARASAVVCHTAVGPYRMITQLGVYGFDDQTKRINLISVHPGFSVEDIQANSEFTIQNFHAGSGHHPAV